MVDQRYFETPRLIQRVYPYQAEINALVGMKAVKEEIRRIASFALFQEKRLIDGLKPLPMSKNFVFLGPPGTGKTTVARLLGQILKAHGGLSKGDCIEVDRASLVGSYIGQSENATKEKIKEAYGSVLFIDEFHSLANAGHDNDFGCRVIDVLVKAIEDKRENMAVVIAGYPEEMKKALKSNRGLRSRFTNFINFPDYSSVELIEIFSALVIERELKMTKDAYAVAGQLIRVHHAGRDDQYANARDIRDFVGAIGPVLSARIMNEGSEHSTIKPADLREAARLIGFNGA